MIKSQDLSWIVVSDIKKAKDFFTKTIGLKELKFAQEFGWAELGGENGGAIIGLAEEGPMMETKPGSNAVITLTVDNLEKTIQAYQKAGVELIGETMEVPGHVKLQLFKDLDGNLFQIVENLN